LLDSFSLEMKKPFVLYNLAEYGGDYGTS